MNLSRAFRLLTLMLLSGCLASCHLFPPQTTPPDVNQAAVKGLDYFSQRLSSKALSNLGYQSRAELAVSDIRAPYRIHLISMDAMENFTADDDLNLLLAQTDQWLFPLRYQNRITAMLSIDNLQGKPTAVAIGAQPLARTLSQMRNRWPATEGYTLKYIRLAHVDMISVSQVNKVRIIPLSTLAAILKLPETEDDLYGIYKPQVIFPPLVKYMSNLHR